MTRLQVPYRSVLLEPRDFDAGEFDAIVEKYLEASRRAPVILEVCNDNIQYLVFINEGQLYYVAVSEGAHYRGMRLRDFFSGVRCTPFPTIIAYQADLVLYHSLLVYLQRKPDLKVSSELVDLDELLDRAEEEKMSAVLSAREPAGLTLLRYQSGKAIACYGSRGEKRTPCANPREEFLVKVYTVTARIPLEINLFTDLVVTHAEDVKPIPAGYAGPLSSFYLTRPPRVVVRLKGRPLKTYQLAGAEVTIGRLPENTISIDNLSVSRKHASIASAGNGYTLTDLGSKNGTLLNGAPVASAILADGDQITIGKYELLFQIPTSDEGNPENLDQTVIIPHFRACAAPEAAPARTRPRASSIPRLLRKSSLEEFPLGTEKTVIGKGRRSDIKIGGLFTPGVTVEVVRRGDDFVLQKVRGRRTVSVNGSKTDEKVLEEEDLITIGSEEFVFKA